MWPAPLPRPSACTAGTGVPTKAREHGRRESANVPASESPGISPWSLVVQSLFSTGDRPAVIRRTLRILLRSLRLQVVWNVKPARIA